MIKALLSCESCKGKKQLLGLGMIYKDCGVCKGIGFVNPKVEEAPKIEEKVVQISTKKYGRKAKDK